MMRAMTRMGALNWFFFGRTKKVVAASLATCFRSYNIGCVRFNLEDHVACSKTYFGIGVRCNVVQEMDGGIDGGLGSIDSGG